MKYGFVIDNRKCIGCHACTTACKAEHQVPVGVNRTWVKQVEKGIFPHSRRLFSVLRCNHCSDAPCVEICPVEALFIRDDGIVDFNKNRCIGCKSCMQACPYDALYIDPDNHTAAKCNYCAHRIDIGLEPACVNVCPEHAIISGDLDNPNTEIAQLVSREQVSVRKPEKGTIPNVYYIDGDQASLIPSYAEGTAQNMWGSQALGVGHYSKEAEKLAFSNADVLEELGKNESKRDDLKRIKNVELIMGKAREAYNAPSKGVLWGWEVSSYIFTKAIATGVFLVPFLAWLTGNFALTERTWLLGLGAGLVFMGFTGLLLVKDLDRPDRFLNVLLRPQWNSWLVRGGYAITIYGTLLVLMIANHYFRWGIPRDMLNWITAMAAVITSIYTAFLLAQAKGRDFWQSPALAVHMLLHTVLAGVAFYGLLNFIFYQILVWTNFLTTTLIVGIVLNLFIILFELWMTHPTADAKKVAGMIKKGRYKHLFWVGVLLIGNIIPLLLIQLWKGDLALAVISILVLIGIYISEHIWVEAPQKISLS